ncbi:isoleucyl-tRNA synthetase [Dentipellis sp. KUC8613]|nr:isoleucyl-tRNA synthetase [Dentipellis sp. KUC8613]
MRTRGGAFASLRNCGRRWLSTSVPCLSGDKAAGKVDSKAFSKTLLLPKTSFPLWTDPAKTEVAFRHKTCDALYKWQREKAKGPTFVLHDGPPYANGNLHMGHALNKILKDIINRYHVSLGHQVHYIPGWDCHGLPIENKALKELGVKKIEDLNGSNGSQQIASGLTADTIRSAAEATAKREIETQKSEFQELGIMADWSDKGTYRTLDHDYEMRQLRIFQKMVEKGLIYQYYRPVYFSPSSQTALAEAELVYRDDHVSHSVYVTYTVDVKSDGMKPALRKLLAGEKNVKLLVWTTTPWTLTANMGIAVNPEMEYLLVKQKDTADGVLIVAADRLSALAHVVGDVDVLGNIEGSDLAGTAYHGLFQSLVDSTQRETYSWKIVPSSHVTPDSGTGLVHCAPSHGYEDYNLFSSLEIVKHSSDVFNHVDKHGAFGPSVSDIVGDDVAQTLVGKPVLSEGSKSMVKLLEQLGVLMKVEKIKHRYPYDWKTNEPIIITATQQWFANLDNIKEDALTALEDVAFQPSISRNRLDSFIKSRSEWCISRQRVWGIPIPWLSHNGDVILDSASLEHIISVLEEKGLAHWWNGPIEDFVLPALRTDGEDAKETWVRGTDTMDVWFDSGTSWAQLSERDGRPRADVCLEGSDQHRGWFQSQLLTAVGASGVAQAPYGTLITHGMVLDQDGKKMSKSLGNVVSPMEVIKGGKDKKKNPAYGADVLRLWAATVEYWRDMSIGPTVLAQAAEALRKIRNSARFILGNIGNEEARAQLRRVEHGEFRLAERYVMHELYKLEQTALDGYATYNFPKVINSLTNFANITLSSLYFDITKDTLYADSLTSFERRSVVTALEQVLATITHVMAPVLPHLAEEIHHTAVNGGDDKASGTSVFMKTWKPLSSEWEDVAAEKDMTALLTVRSSVLALLEKARSDKNLKSSLEAEVDIVLPNHGPNASPLVSVLRAQEPFLKTLFIVSDATVTDKEPLKTSEPAWLYTDSLGDIHIRVRPATHSKCPRCWTYSRKEEDTLCARCTDVVPPQP